MALGTVLSRAMPKDLPDLDPNMGTIGDRAHGDAVSREAKEKAHQHEEKTSYGDDQQTVGAHGRRADGNLGGRYEAREGTRSRAPHRQDDRLEHARQGQTYYEDLRVQLQKYLEALRSLAADVFLTHNAPASTRTEPEV